MKVVSGRWKEGRPIIRLKDGRRGEFFLLFLILMAIGLIPRFYRLDWDVSPNGVDEGIQIMAGRMMDYGYHLYSQINSVQPPFMLLIYGATDASPELYRFFSVISSAIILSLVMYASGKAAGWRGMVGAGSFLLIDVMFLLESRLASLDMFALLWSSLGIAFFIAFREKGRNVNLMIAGFLIGISTMTKLFGGITFGAVGLILLMDILFDRYGQERPLDRFTLPPRGEFRTGLQHPVIFTLSFSLVVLLFMMLFGPMEVIRGTFLNQLHRPVASPLFKAGQFMKYLLPILASIPFFILGIGPLYRRREGVVLIIGSVFLIYFILQAMTFDHHLIFLSPVIAIGAGIGFRRALRMFEYRHSILRAAARISPMILVIAASLVSSGMVLHVHYRGEPAQEEVAAIVRDLTSEEDFIISGDPLISVLADRRVPPSVVNVAHIQYPSITSDALNTSVVEYGIECVVLSYHLMEMKGFRNFVDENFHLRAVIFDRQNPLLDDEVSYSIYYLCDDSILRDVPGWGALKTPLDE